MSKTKPPAGKVCAAAGCTNPVPTNTTGRPFIYCSPSCRPSAHRTGKNHRPRVDVDVSGAVVVEVDHTPIDTNQRPAGRIWLVRLRRGQRQVIVTEGLGRPSADYLANQITELLQTRRTG